MRPPVRLARLFAVLTLATVGNLGGPANGIGSTTGGPIGQRFPAQANAVQQSSKPATMRWALIVGISDYTDGVRDTIGGKRDALQTRRALANRGWRDDHILVLTDGNATKSLILTGLDWLADKTTKASTAVFAYAGHEMPFRTSADGDDETRDVAIQTHDNRFILDGDLGRMFGEVRASHMWIHFATCRAGGFNDAGTVKAGRIVTYSSPGSELSFEDPDVDHSVFGYYTVVQGLLNGRGDTDGNGRISIEEAFRYAKPLVQTRTSDRQHPLMVDRWDGPAYLSA